MLPFSRRHSPAVSRSTPVRPALRLEHLEDRTLLASTLQLVSTPVAGTGPGPAVAASNDASSLNSSKDRISDDGRFILFQSNATNLVPGQVTLTPPLPVLGVSSAGNAFLFDRLLNTVT